MQEDPIIFEDTKSTLKAIVERGGKNYIISHRDLQVVDFLETKEVIQYFTYVITSNDGFPRKPDPTSIQYLFDHFGVKAEEAIMIGDRELDVQAGNNAKIDTALYSTDGLVDGKDANYVIHHLSDVLSLEKKNV